MTDYLDTLSDFVSETGFDSLTPGALDAVRDVTLDTLGAMVVGSQQPENAAFASRMAQRSPSAAATVFGHGLKADPMTATLVNATAGVALEVDEGNRFGGGHPAIHSLPGAIALAEEMGASGRDFVESALVGYELESRIGGATKPRPNVHSHGHWGVIGTAVAAAKLKGYSARQVRELINIAASMSPANSWQPAFRGATVRNLYPGRSGHDGLLALQVYESGFTGLEDAPADVFGTILGESFDRGAAVANMPGEYRIEQNYFKFYACCRLNHPALDAVFDAREGGSFDPDEVVAVDISAPSMLDGMLGEYPENMLAAKFNVPYAVAASLVRGSAGVDEFYSDVRDDARIRELAAKVSVRVEPPPAHVPAGGVPPTEARIRLAGDRELVGRTAIIKGDYGNRLPRERLVEKFHALNDPILGAQRAAEVVDAVSRLEEMSDIRELTALLAG